MTKKFAVAILAAFALTACAQQSGTQLELNGKAHCAVKKNGHYEFDQIADCSNRGR